MEQQPERRERHRGDLVAAQAVDQGDEDRQVGDIGEPDHERGAAVVDRQDLVAPGNEKVWQQSVLRVDVDQGNAAMPEMQCGLDHRPEMDHVGPEPVVEEQQVEDQDETQGRKPEALVQRWAPLREPPFTPREREGQHTETNADDQVKEESPVQERLLDQPGIGLRKRRVPCRVKDYEGRKQQRHQEHR